MPPRNPKIRVRNEAHLERTAGEERVGKNHQDIDGSHDQSGLEDDVPLLALSDLVSPDDASDKGKDEHGKLVSHHDGGKVSHEDGEDDGHLRVDDDSDKHGAGGEGEKIKVSRRGDGEEGRAQNIGDHQEKLENSHRADKSRGEEKHVFLGESDLPDVLGRKLINAGEKKEREEDTFRSGWK